MNIGIIGQGFVGYAIYEKFKNYFTVRTYDVIRNRCTHNYKEVVDNSDIIFVCLPALGVSRNLDGGSIIKHLS